MNKGAVIVSCIGALLVTFNKPIAKAMHWWNVETGGRALDLWSYRAPVIFFGGLLLFLSLISNFVDS